MLDLILLLIAMIIFITYFIERYVLKKELSDVKMEKEVKEAVLSLFLYAEKQGWTGEAKMSYVAHKIHDLIPGKTLQSVLKEETLLSYLQKMYDSLKNELYKH